MSDAVVATSLGYFMTPLVNVLFGAIFLRERLTRWQSGAVLPRDKDVVARVVAPK